MKKFLSVLLAVCLLAGCLPLSAGAAEYIWPTATHTLSRSYAQHGNKAIDISVSSGTTVVASRAGTVYSIYTGCKNVNGLNTGTCKGKGTCNPNHGYYKDSGYCNDNFGNGVIIKHSDGTYAHYAHFSEVSSTLKVGTAVSQGQVLGKSGSSGMSTGPHLHFEIHQAGNTPWAGATMNPETLINSNSVSKPTNTRISLSMSTASINDTVSLTWSATNATSYWLHIYKDGKDYINQSFGQSTSLTRTYEIGHYDAYVEPSNSSGAGPLAQTSFEIVGLFYLDLNAMLDGKFSETLYGYAIADVYINGSPWVWNVVNYYEKWPTGTKYEIKNIRCHEGRKYNGVYSGTLSGIIGTSDTEVRLSFSTKQNQVSSPEPSAAPEPTQNSEEVTPIPAPEEMPYDPTPENSFIDVPNGAYFAEAVNWAVDKGITAGTSSNTFSPNAICTRAQAVTFLWRAAGSPEPSGSSSKFVDVAGGQYYTKAVQWAVEKGITGGTSATTFSPNDKCTRAQIVTFQYRMHNSPSVSGVSPFADVPPTLYYANAVAWAVENGITSGTSASTFSPHNDCSRGQIVTFLYRDMN